MSTESGANIEPTSTQLRIYPSFTEIRQRFDAPKVFTKYFTRDVFTSIIRGSLAIEDIPIESKQVIPKANNLSNQTLFYRRSAKDEAHECRMIQVDDLLIQDIETERYLYAQRNQLEYKNIPEQEGTEVTYKLKQPGNATLSYQIHGISWSPHYDLNVLSDDCQHMFQAFAEINNTTKQQFQVNQTELFGGEIQIEKKIFPIKRLRSRSRSRSPSVESGSEIDEDFLCDSAGPSIRAAGELAGLYLYTIDQPFTLLPRSTIGLPFIIPTISIHKCFGLTLLFSSHTEIRKLQRKYCIESIDKFLPGGPLTIREQGRLVGVATLPDMAVGDKHFLNAGQDPDISLTRQIKVISKERHSAVYSVQLTFKNIKKVPVKFEYVEVMNDEKIHFTIIPKGTEDSRQKIQISPTGIEISNKKSSNDESYILKADGGEQIFEYEVHRNYAKKSSSYRKRRREE